MIKANLFGYMFKIQNVLILLNDYSIKGLVIEQNERFQFSLMSDNEIKR